MSFEFIKRLPTPDEIRKEYPLSEELTRLRERRNEEIRDVLTGKSDKFLVIIGPCSADNEEAVCDYVTRLAKVNEKVKDKLVLIPRIYTNKPRTTGEGYKGIIHQPDPEKKPDFLAGLIAMRKMQIRAIAESGLTAADEMLYPENWRYVSDILSYVAIGARSVEDQQHRLTVSGFRRYEKPHQRGFFHYAQLRLCRPASPLLYLPRLGSSDFWERFNPHYLKRFRKQIRQKPS